MGLTLSEKIIQTHLQKGNLETGQEIAIRIDQTLTQDSTGTMAYLQFEAIGIPRVRTELSVAYVDHNTLQTGFENADDHYYIQTVAQKYGLLFSKPGNGVCHQVHIERFGVPGKTLLGSDSHTPTCGGLGMLAIGAGGLDVAVAMGGGPYWLTMPQMVRINLVGTLQPWVSAKDIILDILRRLSVKGGVGRIIEYGGEGVSSLTVPERATLTNMGAELGATTSIFPSDEETRRFLKAQGREEVWRPLSADPDAVYDETLTVNLSALVPLAAKPHSPDHVAAIEEIGTIKIDQVAIGSCTNSSYMDLMKTAAILRGKTIHPDVSLVISPGSRQVINMLAENGALSDLISAGARILEAACGPCIGMGQAPRSNAVSLRTYNRNFKGRSGTETAKVYLVSPETAAASALTGVLTDPRTLGTPLRIDFPNRFLINDNMIIKPAKDGSEVTVVRGPNIQPFPINQPLQGDLSGKVLIKLGDNITTDHIMPSHAKLLPFRSNIPYLSDYCLTPCDPEFPARARREGGGFIVAGTNYGQGSSREHAALVPLYLGIKGVLAQSFARIHRDNLMNNGILPLIFEDPEDISWIDLMDELFIEKVDEQIKNLIHEPVFLVLNRTKNRPIRCTLKVSERQAAILLAGGLLNYTRKGG